MLKFPLKDKRVKGSDRSEGLCLAPQAFRAAEGLDSRHKKRRPSKLRRCIIYEWIWLSVKTSHVEWKKYKSSCSRPRRAVAGFLVRKEWKMKFVKMCIRVTCMGTSTYCEEYKSCWGGKCERKCHVPTHSSRGALLAALLSLLWKRQVFYGYWHLNKQNLRFFEILQVWKT